MNDLNEFLSIKSKTWIRDSHGLFDYESNTVKENFLVIQNPTLIVRRKHDLKEIKPEKADPCDNFICAVGIKDNSKLALIIKKVLLFFQLYLSIICFLLKTILTSFRTKCG